MMRVIGDIMIGVPGILAAVELPTDTLADIAAKYGAAGLVIAWFMWRDFQDRKDRRKREAQMNKTLDERNAFERETLTRLSRAIERCPKRDSDRMDP